MTVQMRIVKIRTTDNDGDPDIPLFETWSEVVGETGELVYVAINGDGVDTAQDLIDQLVGEADVEYV